uniref:Uncharacterized protein n=1 Tax=Candidatus Kentrum sp. SD TaxID=2126332 RepID=A0A450YRH2_9GAMM|nr:MAG: hypothetical protein BECKSD772F_GA0070984_103516 [Candidatus Kentron sp. SD]VFK44106.1 MAG: hypothetical protein BECKSD772E_GA0070983_103316 [Candidatus Kentron sp. SD]
MSWRGEKTPYLAHERFFRFIQKSMIGIIYYALLGSSKIKGRDYITIYPIDYSLFV